MVSRALEYYTFHHTTVASEAISQWSGHVTAKKQKHEIIGTIQLNLRLHKIYYYASLGHLTTLIEYDYFNRTPLNVLLESIDLLPSWWKGKCSTALHSSYGIAEVMHEGGVNQRHFDHYMKISITFNCLICKYQKVVRPWPDQTDLFRRPCTMIQGSTYTLDTIE